ncbi:MAG: hypothetical protein KDB16_20240 [Acidimicrobiales bacterium]|nr:hypothetical protein [Acidimicrobiales bacterium]
MSEYPPPGHLLSSLGLASYGREDGFVVTESRVDPSLLTLVPGTPPGLGVLAPMVDIGSASAARRHLGDEWIVTSDMWVHEMSPIDIGSAERISIVAWDLRIGKRSLVIGCEVAQGEREIATGTLEFTRIRRDASPFKGRELGTPGAPVPIGSGPLLDVDLGQVLQFEYGADSVGLSRHAKVANSVGTLQGGAIAMLADAAAVHHMGGGRVVDLHFRFLGQTGEGPAVGRCRTVRSDSAGATVSVEIVDASAADALVGWAIVRVET